MVTAIKMHECKVLNFCKRSFAFLCAVGIMGYSLLTAPLFGVHAISINSNTMWGLVSSILGNVGHFLENDQSTVLTAVTGVAMPFLQEITDDAVENGAPLRLPRPIPTETFAGSYQDGTAIQEIIFYFFSWDYSDLTPTGYGVICDNFIVCRDYTVSIAVYPSEDWISSSDREDIDIKILFGRSGSSSYCQLYPVIQLKGTSGITPSIVGTFYFKFRDGSIIRYPFSGSGSNTGYATNFQSFHFRLNSSAFYYPSDFESYLNSCFPLHDPGSKNYFMDLGQFSSSIKPPYPTMPAKCTNNTMLVDYYNNQIRNYVINNYSDYPDIVNQYITYNEYVEQLPTETTPTETIDPSQPSTGNGTVVIIDPFTLPPEWLEDDAELDTDHYILDSEQWESPFETIARYKSQVSAASIEEEEPWLDNGQLVAPLDVTQAMESFQYFAIELLDRSGILVVVASCLAFGLVIRIISLK